MTYIILGVIAFIGIAVLIIFIQAKRVQTLKTENESLRSEIGHVTAHLHGLRDYLTKNKILMEESNEKRKELDAASDSELLSRAHSLFGGVCDPPSGGGSGPSGYGGA